MIYSGAGNTFVLLDNRTLNFDYHTAAVLCDAHKVDGCILVESSSTADAFMRTFNRDGSEAQMCGNGLRCFIDFLRYLGTEKERYSVETLAGLHYGGFEGDQVAAELPGPTDIRWNIAGRALHHLNTGVPHFVKFVEDVSACDVEKEGYALCHDEELAPEGANVNFVQTQDDGTLLVRTFERGVDAETLACGTGCTASALAANHLHMLSSPIQIRVKSGDLLKISFTPDWQSISLVGPVQKFDNIEAIEL